MRESDAMVPDALYSELGRRREEVGNGMGKGNRWGGGELQVV